MTFDIQPPRAPSSGQRLAAARTGLRAAPGQRLLIAGRATGSVLHGSEVALDDFDGPEGCNEILNTTRPGIMQPIHRGYPDDRVRPDPAGLVEGQVRYAGDALGGLADFFRPRQSGQARYVSS